MACTLSIRTFTLINIYTRAKRERSQDITGRKKNASVCRGRARPRETHGNVGYSVRFLMLSKGGERGREARLSVLRWIQGMLRLSTIAQDRDLEGALCPDWPDEASVRK